MAETRTRVITVAFFWYLLSVLGPRSGPPGFERFNRWATRRFTAWQLSILTLVGYYVVRNIDAILNLHPKLARHKIYEPRFETAVTIMTAMTAGFMTAKSMRPKFIRDLASLVFAGYYIFTPDHAMEKVRKFNENPSVEGIRTSFEIMDNPYLDFIGGLMRPRLRGAQGMVFYVPRPKSSVYLAPVELELWYDKPLTELKSEKKIIFHIHGGGFISNTPRLHADSLTAWARQTQLPIIAINYRRAPEYPFPYAVDECFDAYTAMVESRGLCFGVKSKVPPRVVITGDSAGGNFSAVLMIKIIMSGNKALRDPVDALVLTYPALDLSPVGCYGEREMEFFRQEAGDDRDTGIFETRTEVVDLYKSGVHPVSMEHLVVAGTPYVDVNKNTPLSLSSRVLFMSDRVIPAEGLYVMVIMYIGTDRGIDFHNDPLVSPLWASDELLAQFPRCYVTCGTCDPLVDDTVIFTSRLRNARRAKNPKLNITEDIIRTRLVKGVSHGFLQFDTIYPETKSIYKMIGSWFLDAFERSEQESRLTVQEYREILDTPKVDTYRYNNPFPGY
ncbi:uncharacterized protein SAPINGB_P001402 [Magnusiomyces paraingens]|uniref:Alpha/beta hydrolase fold-3 domain-containing protein n=1 Tax=Magnusiomyces paraingens TaxID=2606893 RepID=A0A5E8B625_9ASCO|nr:uncharacterized protein SAPINGB_P001402 [Saprochaete ingens]VVT46819.1 unnamed protein product [Saprochaete ingens]